MAEDSLDPLQLLSGSHSWVGEPGVHASMMYFMLEEDGSGKMVCGFGQTIYTQLLCRFSMPKDDTLEIEFQPSPRGWRKELWTPDESNRSKILTFTIEKGEFEFQEAFVSVKDWYGYKLSLSEHPYPNSFEFPHPVAKEYYGYRADRPEM